MKKRPNKAPEPTRTALKFGMLQHIIRIMKIETPEHHIHQKLENIKREAEENPSTPANNSMLHKIVFLQAKIAERAEKSTGDAVKFAKLAFITSVISIVLVVIQIILAH